MDYIEQVLVQPNPITLGKFLSAQFNLSFYPWGLQKFCTKSIRYIVIALQWWVPVLDNPNICTSTSGFFFFFASVLRVLQLILVHWIFGRVYILKVTFSHDVQTLLNHSLLHTCCYSLLSTSGHWLRHDSTHFHCSNKQTNKKIIQGLCCSFKQTEGEAV